MGKYGFEHRKTLGWGGRKQGIYPGKTAYFTFCLRLGQNLP